MSQIAQWSVFHLVCSYWRLGVECCWTKPHQNHCWRNTGTLLRSPLVVLRYENQSQEFPSVFALSPWDLSQYWKTSHFFAMRTWAKIWKYESKSLHYTIVDSLNLSLFYYGCLSVIFVWYFLCFFVTSCLTPKKSDQDIYMRQLT